MALYFYKQVTPSELMGIPNKIFDVRRLLYYLLLTAYWILLAEGLLSVGLKDCRTERLKD